MTNGTSVTSVIEKVLGHKGLPLEPKIAQPAPQDVKGGSSVMRAFRLNIKGLRSSLIEDLILIPLGNQDTSEAVRIALSDTTCEEILVAAEAEAVAELSQFASADRRVKVEDFSGLFKRLCEIPDSLPEMVLSKARRDFNRTIYQQRYQERRFRVVSTPDWVSSKRLEHPSAHDYLVDWARADSTRHPMLLLGERGSGKTWQLFRFCRDMSALHRREPWIYGPAFFFELREEHARLGPYGVSIPVFSNAVLREYPSVRYLWDAPLVEAFLSAGHTILCIDGFEEISHIASGGRSGAVELLRRICATLPLGTRFVITCRPSHFGSLDQVLEIQAWPGLAVRDTFEIVALDPFEDASVEGYLGIVISQFEKAEAIESLHAFLASEPAGQLVGEDASREAVREALRTCSKYPALLAAMVEHTLRNRSTQLHPTDLLTAALVGAMVDYNIQMGKAQDVHYRPDGTKVPLGTEERMELLGELAWHVAGRGQERIDVGVLPPYIEKYFGLDLESVRTDLRTNTLFEVGPSSEGGTASPTDGGSERTESSSSLSFALPFGSGAACEDAMGAPQGQGSPSVMRTAFLARTAQRKAPAGTKSVSGAFLLAQHVAKKLERATTVPIPASRSDSAPLVDRLRALGEVPLGLVAAGILREIIERGQVLTRIRSLDEIVDLVVTNIKIYALRRDLSVFSSCLRYIGHNLEAMGLVSSVQREEIDPWSDQRVDSVVRGPNLLPGYSMVLVPSPAEGAMPQYLKEMHIAEVAPRLGHPYLLGVREVTNEDFLAFLTSPEGEDWRVERMTLAGSTGGRARSPWAVYANEYYLYFWEGTHCGSGPRRRPLRDQLSHPVVYVSWYACAAFCDWLTRGENPGQEVYADYWANKTDSQKQKRVDARFRSGYRLPSAREWSWAARGGHLDIACPWELYPLFLPEADLQRWKDTPSSEVLRGGEQDARRWMQTWRDDYRSALLTMSKERIPVLMDPFNPMGISGMMGNVKEWCDDLAGTEHDKRPILGATSYLGETSFHYDYGMVLFLQNTNPDVGFRIARPLSDGDIEVLHTREEELCRSTGPASCGAGLKRS